MVERLNRLERAVMEVLLSRDEPGYDVLRDQLEHCFVSGRKMSGVGFFTELEVDPSVSEAPAEVGNPVGQGRAFPDDAHAEIAGLDHGAGFVLWLEHGRLATLEGYAYEAWPDEIRDFSVRWERVSRG